MIRHDLRIPEGGPPPGKEDRWERLVQRILLAAEPELALRSRQGALVLQIEDWLRPVLSAAAVMILIFGSILVAANRSGTGLMEESPLIVEAVLPNPLSLWLEMGTQPTLVEVVRAFEEGG